MKKTLGILGTGIALCTVFAPTAVSAAFGEPAEGNTRVEIVDFEVIDGLPTAPGEFTLTEVPDIDFGVHTLEAINTNATVEGTYEGALEASDFRPIEESQVEALQIIGDYVGEEDPSVVSELEAAWTNAILAGDWSLEVRASNLEAGAIASALTINGEDVLSASATFGIDYAVGTFDHIEAISEETPTLTVVDNTPVGEYNGTITYTAMNAIV